jgi:hypothetical protein
MICMLNQGVLQVTSFAQQCSDDKEISDAKRRDKSK